VAAIVVDEDNVSATAYAIADNRTAELAAWDEDALGKHLQGLMELEDFDHLVTGFTNEEIEALIDFSEQPLLEEDEVPDPPDDPVTKPGDLWCLGNHRLLCGDAGSVEDLDRLLAGVEIHLVNMDPPYNVKVEPRSNNAIAAGLSSFQSTHHQKLDLARHPEKRHPKGKMRPKDRPLQNDFVSDEDFEEMLRAWFGNAARVLIPGGAFYIWGGYANIANYPPALRAAGLYFSQGIVWDKEHPVLTRKDFMGSFELCQPAGTKVLTRDGEVPIESLTSDDRVVSFSRHNYRIIGVRKGATIHPTKRQYDGELLGVVVGDKVTQCTPMHLWTVRLCDGADGLWCTYLMRKGAWWRAGKSLLVSSWGFGLKHRLYTEEGDQAWILGVYDSSLEAIVDEHLIQAKYGIPTMTWSDRHHEKGCRTLDDVRRVYDRLDLDVMREGAHRLLHDFGRRPDAPILTATWDHVKVSRRVTTMVRACNLLPRAMVVPVPVGKGLEVKWEKIRAVDRQPFSGPVYSMDVAKYHHYVADGIVTHNCFYGWKEGAGHRFFGPTNVTDLWHVKKVSPQKMSHLTEKPVELATRAIAFSSKRGEHVLDLFGGSGSTLISAEGTGRRAFLMEIDPAYCDVIVTRWEGFAKDKAVLDGTDNTLVDVKKVREAERVGAG
jgi:DNA modification methylase